MLIDLDDFWPPAETLVGMEFATDEEFERCQAILAQQLDIYNWAVPASRFVAVRRDDLALFTNAGLQFAEFKIVDRGDRPLTEAEREYDQKALHEALMGLVERMRREQ